MYIKCNIFHPLNDELFHVSKHTDVNAISFAKVNKNNWAIRDHVK
jgi:hypothetical protein